MQGPVIINKIGVRYNVDHLLSKAYYYSIIVYNNYIEIMQNNVQ